MYRIRGRKKYLKKIFSAMIGGIFLVASPFSFTKVFAEENDTEVEELFKKYEENLKEIEKIAGEKEKSQTETKSATEVEVFDPNEEFHEVKETPPNNEVNQPQNVEEEIIIEIPEKKFSFDWRGTSLAQSIYGIAKIAEMGVVVNTEVKGTVYTSLKDVTCREALDYLGRAFNFNYMIEKGNIIITKEDFMKQSRTFFVNYASKEKIVEELKALGIDASNIYANQERGTISVTGTTWELSEAGRRIREIDHPVSQCLVLAQLIEVSHGKDRNLGFTYTLPTYTHEKGEAFTGIRNALPFSISLTANREIANGNVIARPMILMLNGEKGNVSFGDSVPVMGTTSTNTATTVTVEYRDVGTNLGVTPIINTATDEITMNLEIEVSNITGWRTSGGTTAPQISTRKATTSTHLKSGESFVIGGLMSERELNSLSGIPGLMNLPILGSLFRFSSKSKSYSEVYVMITPYIVDEGTNPQELMQKLKAGDTNGK